MAKKTKKLEEIYVRGKDLVEFYRENPCIAAHELLGVDLAPIQRLVFRDMWFKSYVIVVAGRGYGKSQYIQSLTHFNGKGLVYLNEELPTIPSYLKDGEEEIIDWDDEVYTSEGFRNTKKLCLEKGIDGKFVKTVNGFENRGSNHHPLLVLNEDCDFIYKGLDELEIGDRVCIQRSQQVFGSNLMSLDDSYLVGLFIGDGSINAGNPPSITTEDKHVKDFCIKYCEDNSVKYREDKDKRTKNTSSIVFKGFNLFFEKHKVGKVLSYDKSVPYSIRTATKEVQVEFLRGYFDADGTVHNTNGGVSCCSVSKKLLREVQMMLLNFGIVSRLREKKTKSNFGRAYLLDILSEDAHKFKEYIGFGLERKQKILNDYFSNKKLNVNKDTIPYALDLCYEITKYYHNTYTTSKKPSFRISTGNKKELTYSRLHRFLIQCREIESAGFNLVVVKDKINKLKEILKYNYYFDTVVSVEDWKGDCYDFEMDMEKSIEPNYFSNGFINHNTFALGLLSALSAMLYPGNRIGLIGPVFRQSVPICPINSSTYATFWSSTGLKTGVENMYNYVKPNLTMIQSLDTQNTVLSKWKNDERACISIKTTKGFELPGSIDHSIMVLNKEDSTVIYKELQDITEDDYIVIKRGFNYFSNNDLIPNFDEFEHNWRTKDCSIPKELTPDLAYWMGLVVGDGCVSVSKNKRKQRVDFVSEDQDLLDSFARYLREYFLVNKEEHIDRRNRKNDTWEIQYFCKKLVQYLLKCGFTKTTALDKKVPDVIKKASREIFIAFLQGLFDTDGGVHVQKNKSCEIAFNTSSIQLAKEVHSVLLNLGIISNFSISKKAEIRKLPQGSRLSKCSNSYKIRITGKLFIKLFNDVVGFRCIRKKEQLNNYINSHLKKEFGLAKSLGLPSSLVQNDYSKLQKLYEQGIYFVKLKDKDYFFAPTVDIEVENEHCYWANGFINHNSKMIFHEVEKLYDQSSILREACAKKPTRGSDTCYLKFKSVGGRTPSYIEALPLSDGSKIRGSRFYTIVVDELAQVPDQILDLVLRPMGATALAPMERVRRLEEQNRLIKAGLATADDFEEEKVNKMIMASSGYYKFNHMWRRMKDHWKMMAKAEKEGKECQYSVWQVPYWDLPEGFLDLNNIAEAKRIMSMSEYSMEYEAAMISDSEGFFKASLLDECTSGSDFGLKLTADSNKSYIMGVDPNQGGKASCGVIILEIGRPNKIVNVIELKSSTTQQLTESIQNLCDKYKIVRIFMDRGGGGKAVMDLLEEGYNNKEPILDRENPDNIHKDGRHILEMVNFSTTWISDANFTTKAMFEDRSLLFPELSVSASDLIAKAYKSVEVLKSQLLSIVVTQTATGILHFDTPSKNMNKDLYSALILAAYGARALERELEEDGAPILYNSSGMVRPREGGANNFSILESGGSGFGSSSSSVSRFGLNTAVLQKKK